MGLGAMITSRIFNGVSSAAGVAVWLGGGVPAVAVTLAVGGTGVKVDEKTGVAVRLARGLGLGVAVGVALRVTEAVRLGLLERVAVRV